MLRQKTIHTVEFNFLAEAQAGEHAHIITEEKNGVNLCEIVREEDNITLCRAKIEWKMKK